MSSTCCASMQERVDRLERENSDQRRLVRRMQLLGCSLAVSLVVLIVAGAQKVDEPRTVTAERFVLVDKAGTVRGEWGIRSFPNHKSSIAFINHHDRNGKRRMSLSVPDMPPVPCNPRIIFHQENGKARLSVGLDTFDDPEIKIYDENGREIQIPMPPVPIGPEKGKEQPAAQEVLLPVPKNDRASLVAPRST